MGFSESSNKNEGYTHADLYGVSIEEYLSEVQDTGEALIGRTKRQLEILKRHKNKLHDEFHKLDDWLGHPLRDKLEAVNKLISSKEKNLARYIKDFVY